MSWITIIVTLLVYFLSKRNGASTTEAMTYAGLAGGATYLLTHSDMMEGTTLAELDGATSQDAADLSGDASESPSGGVIPSVNVDTDSSSSDGLNSVLSNALPFVAGTIVGSESENSSWIWWVIGGVGLWLLLKD